MVLVLQAEISDGQMNNPIFICFQSVPLRQDSECCHRIGESCLKILLYSMAHYLEMTNCCQHRKHCLNDHSHVPSPSLTDLHTLRIALFRVKPAVCKHYHLAAEFLNQRVKLGVVHIGSRSCPPGYKSKLVDNKVEFTSNND